VTATPDTPAVANITVIDACDFAFYLIPNQGTTTHHVLEMLAHHPDLRFLRVRDEWLLVCQDKLLHSIPK